MTAVMRKFMNMVSSCSRSSRIQGSVAHRCFLMLLSKSSGAAAAPKPKASASACKELFDVHSVRGTESTADFSARAHLLNIADDGTLWHLTNGLDVSNGESGLLSGIDCLHDHTLRSLLCAETSDAAGSLPSNTTDENNRDMLSLTWPE